VVVVAADPERHRRRRIVDEGSARPRGFQRLARYRADTTLRVDAFTKAAGSKIRWTSQMTRATLIVLKTTADTLQQKGEGPTVGLIDPMILEGRICMHATRRLNGRPFCGTRRGRIR